MLPNAGCCLLRIVEEMVKILGGGCDSVRQVILHVEAVFPGREMDRRVLTADVDAEVGHITCGGMSWSQRAELSILFFGVHMGSV